MSEPSDENRVAKSRNDFVYNEDTYYGDLSWLFAAHKSE